MFSFSLLFSYFPLIFFTVLRNKIWWVLTSKSLVEYNNYYNITLQILLTASSKTIEDDSYQENLLIYFLMKFLIFFREVLHSKWLKIMQIANKVAGN